MAKRKQDTSKTQQNAPLEAYRRKRDFSRTAEPSGATAPEQQPTGAAPIFVVQKHAARRLHYDFRLEMDGVLKSWAVPKGPSLDPGQKPLAVQTEDHPMEYARFEGIIPQGEYGGGTVMVWDFGQWEPIGDLHAGYNNGDLKFRLRGEKLRGEWALVRMSGASNEGGKNWLLIKKRDGEAQPIESYNILGEQPLSVLSGRTMDEIAEEADAVWKEGRAQTSETKSAKIRPKRATAKSAPAAAGPDPSQLTNARRAPLPESIPPQLASTATTTPDGDDWLHEIKLDGYRLVTWLVDDTVRLLTRNGHDWTSKFASVARAVRRIALDPIVLDGEVVVLDERGISQFQLLQNAFKGYTNPPFTYFVFDIVYAAGYDLRRTPLIERKAFLKALLDALPFESATLQYCDHIIGKGSTVYRQACDAGLEGIVSKRIGSTYDSRRSDSWRKIKRVTRRDFVVGGYTDPSGSRSGFGALLLGMYNDDGKLVYCGRVGTGFSEITLARLHAELQQREQNTAPFINPQMDPDYRTAHWIEPALVADVQYAEMTNDNLLRHASFLGLREDIEPKEVTIDSPTTDQRKQPAVIVKRSSKKTAQASRTSADAVIAGVRVSHPERTVYPEDGVTKGDVAEYYAAIAPWMLPHVAGRPLSIVRCPLGLAGETFFQREIGQGFPDSIRGISIDDDNAIVIGNVKGLVGLAQMGVMEIHAWGCREDNITRPDRLVFDLDPGPGIEWEHVVESAKFLRKYLDDLGLVSFVKTTGGKGLHLVIPITRRSDWDEAKAFTKAVADQLVRKAPLNFVATMTKTLRENRIFIDYLRNQEGATAVAAYSTRARNGATVSLPLSWDELSAEAPASQFTVRTVPARMKSLAHDPWQGFDDTKQSITAKMRKAVGG